ncbi:hypothetical protein ABIC02_007436 [Bradyrhizobium sp. RT5a]
MVAATSLCGLHGRSSVLAIHIVRPDFANTISKNAKTYTAPKLSESVRRIRLRRIAIRRCLRPPAISFRIRTRTKSPCFDERDNWAKRSTSVCSRSMRPNSPGWDDGQASSHQDQSDQLFRLAVRRRYPSRVAQGHGMEACPDAADRQAVQDTADYQREKSNVTRKNGKIASKSGHFTTYCMTAHHSTTGVADATTHTAGLCPIRPELRPHPPCRQRRLYGATSPEGLASSRSAEASG